MNVIKKVPQEYEEFLLHALIYLRKSSRYLRDLYSWNVLFGRRKVLQGQRRWWETVVIGCTDALRTKQGFINAQELCAIRGHDLGDSYGRYSSTLCYANY